MKPKTMSFIIIGLTILIVGVCVYLYYQKRAGHLPLISEVKHPDWSKNAVIYEVNIRQYSKEGTFNAFGKDLQRLKNMGADILWIMPVHPIGETDRKGSLGSYYSVRDYKDVNNEYGTMSDFKNLVNNAHKIGLKVIIDWVPNHTSKDNELVKTHPEYYLKDSAGKFISPFDWTDVYRLDYSNVATRRYMIGTMRFWVTETGIDGFRCDVAHMIPVSFWNELRASLDSVKQVFILAEADIPEQHLKGIDMSYDWKFHHLMNDIAKHKKNANDIQKYFNHVDSIYPVNSYLMEFTSNHDENSWNGSEYERLGQGAQAFAVLAATIYGMPLVYNGQESVFKRRLKFFDKDSIDWDNYSLTLFYKKLFDLKHRNKALWNGTDGGRFKRIATNYDSCVFAFTREKESNKVLVICNLSSKQLKVNLKSELLPGNYTEIFTNQDFTFNEKTKLSLNPWQYLVLELN